MEESFPFDKLHCNQKEVFYIKLQTTTYRLDKNINIIWAMITWNATLNVKYENLLVLVEIARVYYYVSTTICELSFSVQDYTKTK